MSSYRFDIRTAWFSTTLWAPGEGNYTRRKSSFSQHGSPKSIFLHVLFIYIQKHVTRVCTKSGLREFFEVSGSKNQVYACWKSYCPCHNFLQKMKQRPLLYVSQSAAHTRVVRLNRGKYNRVHFFFFWLYHGCCLQFSVSISSLYGWRWRWKNIKQVKSRTRSTLE